MGALLFGISLLLLATYLLLLAYYGYGWRRLQAFALPDEPPQTLITVIIPARNEAKNIEHCLEAIAVQDYPGHLLEVIVVDDFSTDGTADVVHKKNLPFVRVLPLRDFVEEKTLNSFKKKGIEIAIGQAKGTLIVSTDADCTMGPQWLRSIAALHEKSGAVFIAAPVKIACRTKFVEIFQSLDFLALQGITAGSVKLRFHTMCNGANLAYTKAAFEAVGGFSGIDTIASGDDMLLMYKIYQQYPQQIRYLKQKAAIVQTAAVPNWKAFFNQRIRWASKGAYYQDKRVFWALVLVYFLNVAALAILVVPFIWPQHAVWAILFLAVKCFSELGFLLPVAKFYNMQKMMWWFPFCQPLHILYTVIAGFLGKFGKYSWKGRVVK
jgi:cellulose synthase/poly-beta-1,6-N-acetylglucosamine synthase-like glycosyltransferase